MKQLKLFFALFAMLALGVGNAWGAETLYKTALFGANYNSKKVSSYTDTWTATNDGFVVTVVNANNNNNGWAYIKMGRKSYTSVGSITTQAAIDKPISKVTMTIDAVTAKNINSIKLKTSTDGSSFVEVGNFTISKGEQSVTINNPTANLYYQIEVDCKTGSNGSIQISKVQYYATEDAGTTETAVSVPTFSVPECTFYSSSLDVELSCATDGATIHYTIDGTTPSETSPTYSGVIAINNTTTIKAIAVKDGLTDSEVATATYTKGETVTSYDINFETNALEAYVNWDFSNIAVATTTITAKKGTYYGNTCGKASASIKTKTAIQYPGTLTFYTSKESSNTTSSNWKVLVSENGSTWTEVISFDATTGNKGTWTERTADLSDYENVYVQISYSGSTAVRAIDEISLAQGVAPVKYTLTIEDPENGTLSVTKGGASVASGDQFKAGTSLVVTPTPKAGYVFESLTVGGTLVELAVDGTYTFTMPANDVTVTATFKVNEAPDATLVLSKNGDISDKIEGKQGDVVTLPSFESDCSKAFVGWSENSNCTTEPEYKAGDSYELKHEGNKTIYAVYADGEEGGVVTIKHNVPSTGTSTNMTGNNDAEKFFGLDVNDWSIVSAKNGASNHIGVNKDGTLRLYYHANGGSTLTITAPKDIASIVLNCNSSYKNAWVKVNGSPVTPVDGVYSINAKTVVIGNANTENKQVYVQSIEVTLAGELSNYSTTCAVAPTAEVDPTSVTATAAGGSGKVEVTYENVNTENVAVDLFNDEACTEAFTADWLTASLDGDKNIAYTVAATTLYTERKAYIQLTAPESSAAIDPAVVVIPVTQAGKDKVFESLEELLANITPTTDATKVTVTLTKEPIVDIYVSGNYRNGIFLNVPYQGTSKEIEIYSRDVPAEWVAGGSVSGTLTNCDWKVYNGIWELCPADWSELTYQEPKAVSTVVVSGAPTKTTYVDGETFDPAGLTVTVNYNDATTEVNPTGVTFTVTPTTLVKGQTSVSVTATFNSVTSEAYTVNNLIVTDIQSMTIVDFITSGGTRCYLEGIVSGLTEGNSMKYGNFDLTDASGTIYVYGCLSAAGESQKFAALGVKNGDKIKVIADEYELYGGTKDEAKNVQYVSHISAASITIANITMEVGETKTIAATVVPAEAEVTYTIKENAVNAISLSSNTITALAEGTATITATVAEGATYLGNSVDFTVTVGPKTESEEVVILAEHNGQWYALKAETGSSTNSLAALEVEYFNGVLYNVDEADKASITWKRTIVGNFETFQYGDKYLKGSSSTNLFMEDGTEGKYQWDKDTHTMLIGSTNRTFLYQGTYFKNYAISNAGRTVDGTTYSALPVVTAAKFEDATIIIRDDLKAGNYGTICYENKITNFAGVTFYAVAGREGRKVIFDEVTELEAGMPYLFRAEATKLKMALGNEKATSAGKHNSLQGTFIQIDPAEENILTGNYVMYNNMIKKCGKNCGLNANRAYFIGSELESLGAPAPQAPGRKRVSMDVLGENEATGVDNITENGVIAPAMQGTYDIMGRQLSEPTATGFYIVNGKKVFVVK